MFFLPILTIDASETVNHLHFLKPCLLFDFDHSRHIFSWECVRIAPKIDPDFDMSQKTHFAPRLGLILFENRVLA